MSTRTNPSKRLLLMVSLFIGSSVFLCGAAFFFWLSTGANTDKLMLTSYKIKQRFTQTDIENTIPKTIYNNCPTNLSFDPILLVCVENGQPTLEATATPGNSSSSQSCSVGLIFDPLLNSCVQVELPTNTTINPNLSPPPDMESDDCSVGFIFDSILNACVKIDIQTEELSTDPPEIIDTVVDIPISPTVDAPFTVPNLTPLP